MGINNLRVSIRVKRCILSFMTTHSFFGKKIIMLNKLKDLLVLKKCNSNAQNEEFM